MKKNRKIVYGMSSAALLAAPIATLVSCGTSSDDYKNKVLLKYTWSSNGKQIKALDKIVKYYNEKVKQKGDFEVLLKHVEGGYGDAVRKDIQDIKNDHMGPVASLVIDYPDSLGALKGYGLNFSLKESKDSTADDFMTYFEEKFVSTKIPGSKEGDLFQIPLAKSSDSITVSVPVFAKFLNDGVISFDANSTNNFVKNLKKKIDDYDYANSTDSDKDNVESKWGTATKPSSAYEINDNTFSVFDNIKALGKAIKTAYGKVKDIKNNDIHVFGIDAPANSFYQFYSSKTSFDPEKFIWNIGSDGKAKYPGINDSTSDQYKALKNSVQYAIDLVSESGIKFGGGGEYSSTDFVNEKIAMIMGSSAGYSHNFSGNSKATDGIEFNSKKFKLEAHEKLFVLPNAKNKAKGAIAQTNDQYKNPVYPSTHTGTVAKHSIKLSSLAADNAVKTALKGTNGIVALVAPTGKIGTEAAKNAGKLIPATGGKFPKSIVAGTKVLMPAGNEKDKLGEDEIITTLPPAKVDANDTKNWFLSQGPSIIGIRHGSKDKLDNAKDKNAIKFVRWFFNPASKMEILDSGNTTEINPVKYFETNAGYITPLKDSFKAGNRTNWTSNPGLLTAFDVFKAASDTNGIAFDNPITAYSGAIRKSLVASIKSIYTTHKQDETKTINLTNTVNGIIEQLKSKI